MFNMKKFKIIDTTIPVKRNNKKIILIVISIMILFVLVSIIFLNIKPNNSNKDDYIKKTEIYKDNKITYTYDDYTQDLEAKKNGSEFSQATLSLDDINNKFLQDSKEKSSIDITTEKLKESTKTQIDKFNNIISNHVGWSDDQYPQKDYQLVKSYIDMVIQSMTGEVPPPKLVYEEETTQDMYALIRYCVSENKTYKMLMKSPKYYDILSDYMSIGHPNINIDTISLSNNDNKIFDNLYTSDLQATVTSNGNTYLIYYSSLIFEDGTNKYKILDIKECEEN